MTFAKAHFTSLLAAALLLLAAAACGGQADGEPTCTDGIQNQDETDVDCGGVCGPCLDGQSCLEDADCMSGYCEEGICRAPTCDDGVHNGEETDVDCGGPICDPCETGSSCIENSDCESEICEDGICKAPPSCFDGIQNQDETDVDCGGSCPPCSNGSTCEVDGDCLSGACLDGVCGERATCDDGVQNGEETDIDCGGPDCPPCPEGRLCEEDRDCIEGACEGGICNANVDSCENGVQDGDETDIDCGGNCEPCPPGYGCNDSSDCAGLMTSCTDGICGGYQTCADGMQNGHETDVDCGGPFCHGCLGGQHCLEDRDCASGTCDEGVCTEAPYTCDDGVQSGLETDVDCGGPICEPCSLGHYCLMDADCEFNSCIDGICGGYQTCSDGRQNGHETDVDCGGPICDPCEGGSSCLEDSDCSSGVCTDGVCDMYAPTCGDGEQNGSETDVDCGGPACVPCEVGMSCLEHSDCLSGGCSGGVCVDTVLAIQSSPESLSCDAPGEAVVVREGLSISPLVVVSPKLELDAETDGYWVASDPDFYDEHDPRYSGILLTVESSRETSFQIGNVVSVVGDHIEDDCQSTLHVGENGSVMTVFSPISVPSAYLIHSMLLSQGGQPEVEPYEGVLVELSGRVTDDTGYDGPEGPDQPSWWFQIGDGILVANPFELAFTPEEDERLTVTGVLSHSRGKYLVVPRQEADIEPENGDDPPPPPPPPPSP